jgi:hypothetical protein
MSWTAHCVERGSVTMQPSRGSPEESSREGSPIVPDQARRAAAQEAHVHAFRGPEIR